MWSVDKVHVACWLLFVVRCLLRVACRLGVVAIFMWCLLIAACYLLLVLCGVVLVACCVCLLCHVCWLLSVFVCWCMLFGI